MEVKVEPPLLPLRWRLLHWGPIGAMSIVACICITSTYCHLQWWPPGRSIAGLLDLLIFLLWNYLCLTNLLRASYIGPGYVPLGWRPADSDNEQYLQACDQCGGFKAPRAHHCRQCGRCSMKMDHHCPWINNCCGHRNQGYFIAFLLSAVIGCIHATIILGPSLYYALFRVWYLYYGTGKEPIVELGVWGLLSTLMSLGLAVGVIVAVGFLFIMQVRSVIRNKTAIEDYIVSKAIRRTREDEFIYPYDLGWKENLKQVFTWDLAPISDGIIWTVKDGCSQYDLTWEQMEQKQQKRLNAIEFVAEHPYDAAFWSAWKYGGLAVICSQPCMAGEVRLAIQKGDRILVTRATRKWLYGEKLRRVQQNGVVDGQEGILNQQSMPVKRGWFPKKCAMPANEDDLDYEKNPDASKDKKQSACRCDCDWRKKSD